MARKILVLSLAIGVALAGIAFASGQQDPAAPATTGQKLVLTGSVAIQNLLHPTLKSGDKTYELLVPRILVYQSGLKEGAKVTVEGYQATGLPAWEQPVAGATAVFVTKATIDGKDYDLSQYRGPMMGGGGPGRGYGRGMMGGGVGPMGPGGWR